MTELRPAIIRLFEEGNSGEKNWEIAKYIV